MYRHVVLLCALAAFASACEDPGFEEVGEISKLRVLAIRVDPPEIGPGEVAQIDALVVGTEEVVRYEWEVCLFTDGPDEFYRCSEQDEEVLGAAIGTAPETALPYDLIEEVVGDIDVICAELAEIELGDFASLPSCERGLPVTIRLTVEVREGQGDDREVATARLLLLNEDEAASGSANVRPILDGLLVDDVSSVGVPREVALDPESEVRLQALVEPDTAAESYEETGEDGESTEERERLQLTWFSTHGRFERTWTFFAEDSVLPAELQSNLLNLTNGSLEAAVGDTGELYVVLRDSRGGLDFLRQPFVVVDP